VRKTLKASGADVLDEELPVGMADAAFADDDTLLDPALAERLGEMLERLVHDCRSAGTPAL
jgi:chromate reductase